MSGQDGDYERLPTQAKDAVDAACIAAEHEGYRRGVEAVKAATLDIDARGTAVSGPNATPHSRLPRHCAVCGVDWPDRWHGVCRSCKSGLSCRADTTDRVAPDPPCPGSRRRLAEGDPS